MNTPMNFSIFVSLLFFTYLYICTISITFCNFLFFYYSLSIQLFLYLCLPEGDYFFLYSMVSSSFLYQQEGDFFFPLTIISFCFLSFCPLIYFFISIYSQFSISFNLLPVQLSDLSPIAVGLINLPSWAPDVWYGALMKPVSVVLCFLYCDVTFINSDVIFINPPH